MVLLNRYYRNLLVMLMALSVVACGFKLRGTQALPVELTTLYVQANANSPLTKKLSQSLDLSGVTMVASATDAPYTLALRKERLDRRDITVTDKARASEFELLTEVEIVLNNRQGEEVFEPLILRSERVYQLDRNNIIGSREQETLIRQEMEDEIVRQILQRLAGVSFATNNVLQY